MIPFAPQLHEGDTIPPVALIDQDGRPFSFERLHGRTVVVSFIYTRCTDRCALVTAKLARIAHVADPRTIAVIALTVDPAFDRPAILRRYRAMFESGARWELATGQPAAVRLLERRLGVEPEESAGGRIGHADLVVLLDRSGRIARFVSGDDWTPDVVVTAARAVDGGSAGSFAALALLLNDAAARCGRGAASLGAGAAIALAGALAFIVGLPLVRALFR